MYTVAISAYQAMYYNPSVHLSRRSFLASTVVMRLLGQAPSSPLKIIFAGGHPGDPECGGAGTIARYAKLGADVALLYLNRGEGYCGGASLERCSSIRTAEAGNACKILHARPLFADQYDGRAIVDNTHYETFARILEAERPDAVFTQWPLDHHRDHQAVSLLTLDAWFHARKQFALYYYEVAEDTTAFSPTEYVDISSVENERHAACYAHASQQPDKWYSKQVEITKSRGLASGFSQAEAFLPQAGSKRIQLP